MRIPGVEDLFAPPPAGPADEPPGGCEPRAAAPAAERPAPAGPSFGDLETQRIARIMAGKFASSSAEMSSSFGFADESPTADDSGRSGEEESFWWR